MLLSLVFIISLCGFSSSDAAEKIPVGLSDVPMTFAMASSGTSTAYASVRNGSSVPISNGSFTINDTFSESYCFIGFSPWVDFLKGSYQFEATLTAPDGIVINGGWLEFRNSSGSKSVLIPLNVTNFLGKYTFSAYFDLPTDAFLARIAFCNYSSSGTLISQPWNGTYTVDYTLPVEDTENKGLLEGLLAWIKSIYEGVLNLPTNIANFLKAPLDAIKNAVNAVATSIIDGLKSLFIPEEGYFDGLFDRLNTFFSERFGFLYYPIEHFISWCNRLFTLTDAAPYVTIPEVKYEGEVFIPAMTYTFDFLANEPWATIHDLYLMAIDVALIMSFVQLLQRKYEEVIGK